MHKPMPDYSKAPRGLFVLVEVGRVLTAIANSPGESSRQLLARDAFRAGRNFKKLQPLSRLVRLYFHLAINFRSFCLEYFLLPDSFIL